MRRTVCMNNLRQLGIAINNYEQTFSVIPRGTCGSLPSGQYSCFSAHARLLPFLEANTVSQQIDWTDQNLDIAGRPPQANKANEKFLQQRISVFLCPGDSQANEGANNYRLNLGWSVALEGRTDFIPNTFSSITDGLSNTALFSERLVGGTPGNNQRNALLVDYPFPISLSLACAQAQLTENLSPNIEDPFPGASWLRGRDRQTRYVHFLPPNSRLHDCESAALSNLDIMNARSLHSGGVNLVFFDGHGQFVSDMIALQVWRALGTPSGKEVIP